MVLSTDTTLLLPSLEVFSAIGLFGLPQDGQKALSAGIFARHWEHCPRDGGRRDGFDGPHRRQVDPPGRSGDPQRAQFCLIVSIFNYR